MAGARVARAGRVLVRRRDATGERESRARAPGPRLRLLLLLPPERELRVHASGRRRGSALESLPGTRRTLSRDAPDGRAVSTELAASRGLAAARLRVAGGAARGARRALRRRLRAHDRRRRRRNRRSGSALRLVAPDLGLAVRAAGALCRGVGARRVAGRRAHPPATRRRAHDRARLRTGAPDPRGLAPRRRDDAARGIDPRRRVAGACQHAASERCRRRRW